MHKRPCPPTCATPLTCERSRKDRARLKAVLDAMRAAGEDTDAPRA